jgi:signal transduction histidine kinase
MSRFAPDAPLGLAFARACELSADALAVERVGVWLFVDERSSLRCANLYERSKREHSSGAMLRVADYPTWFSSLNVRKALAAEAAAVEPWAAELQAAYLRPLGISSLLNAGIFVDAEMVGVVCVEHVGTPREWTTEARDFAGSMADLLALRIQSAEVRELRAAFLTDRNRIASQQKMSALEHLAAGVGHDFRNLLQVVIGLGDLIGVRKDVPAEVRRQGEDIVAAAQAGIGLADELLGFARPPQWPPTVIDLAETTASAMTTLRAAAGPNHEVRFSHPGNLGQALIEPSQYARVLMNLVVNARESMPLGGPIEVRLLPVKLTGTTGPRGRYLLLEVTDHGVGMDEEVRQRAFEPFYTTKRKGSGLGLAIVRQVVERAGGIVRVESKPGVGTTFRLFFPRIGASSGGTQVFAIPPEANG